MQQTRMPRLDTSSARRRPAGPAPIMIRSNRECERFVGSRKVRSNGKEAGLGLGLGSGSGLRWRKLPNLLVLWIL